MTTLIASILAAIVQMIPALPTETLDGKRFIVPIDTPTKVSIFVVTFEREARSQASEWDGELGKALSSRPISVFHVAVLEDVPGFVRSFVVAQIRRDVPKDMHARFLIVSSHADKWREMATASSGGEAYIIASTAKGQILWRAHGKFSAAKLAEGLATIASQ